MTQFRYLAPEPIAACPGLLPGEPTEPGRRENEDWPGFSLA